MSKWGQLHFWYSKPLLLSDAPKLYQYMREVLLPILRLHSVESFLMLVEGDCVLLRVPEDDGLFDAVRISVEQAILEPLFSSVTVGRWSPEEDARNRILGSKPKGILSDDEGGWSVIGRTDDTDNKKNWVLSSADLDEEIATFSAFMTSVVGKFTEAYLATIPKKVDNRWLMSLLVHLMLNSVSVGHEEEQQIRDFPYI